MLTIIKAPTILGLRSSGVERLPEVLQQAGLYQALKVTNTEVVTPLPYSAKRDPETHILNPGAIAAYSVKLADAVQRTLQKNHFPLVLGGDCSIILGNMLALKRRGRYGLFFLDGHADFYQPEASETGEAADMDLALASGRGPDIITNIEDQRPLVKDADIVQFGQRDKQETLEFGSQQISDTPIRVYELDAIRKQGVDSTAAEALEHLLQQPIEGFWIHVDADVISDKEMPAVDYRQPGGLTFAELHDILTRLIASKKAVGLSLGIYNPALDKGTKLAPKLVKLLTCLNTTTHLV